MVKVVNFMYMTFVSIFKKVKGAMLLELLCSKTPMVPHYFLKVKVPSKHTEWL